MQYSAKSARAIICLFYVFTVVCSGCSDSSSNINTLTTGELLISPDEVLFRTPVDGTRLSRSTVEVRNIGTGDLPLVAMRIDEMDALIEIIIEDIEDHQGERFLEAGGVEFVNLQWTALDSMADQARFTVVLANGVEVSIPVRTPDIDPKLVVRSDPEGTTTMEGMTIPFIDTPIGQFERAVVTV